jgi:hypothetical protein
MVGKVGIAGLRLGAEHFQCDTQSESDPAKIVCCELDGNRALHVGNVYMKVGFAIQQR